jgi:lipopolysaccharide transport system permease protein
MPDSKLITDSSITDLPVRRYSPAPMIEHPIKMLRELFQDIWAGRELAWRLMVRDISAQYRQSYFGYLWAVLPPMVASLTFVFLNSQGLFTTADTGMPFAAFAMIGTLLWQVFVDSLMAPNTAVIQAKPMLAKINFPREAIFIGALGIVVFNFFIRLVLLVGVLIYFQVPISKSIIFFPVTVVSLILCGVAIGLAVAPLGALYGDVARSIPLISGFWMLLTPVVYPPKADGLAAYLSVINPVSPLIITARQSITGEHLTHLVPFAVVTLGSIVVLLLGFIIMRITMPHLIARMGG